MGNVCSNDIYNQIKQTYPSDFQKFMIGLEMKKILKDKVISAEAKISEIARQIKEKNIQIINHKEEAIQKHFQDVKTKVDKFYLGGKKGLQQTLNTTLVKYFEYSAIQQKFSSIRRDINMKFSQAKQNFQNQLYNQANNQQEKITKQQPKVQAFDHLSDRLKSEVYRKGIKEYRRKIEEQSRTFLAPLDAKIAPQNYIAKFKDIFQLQVVNSLTIKSKQDLNKKLQQLIGNDTETHAILK